jgi:uncharacterized membrane protein
MIMPIAMPIDVSHLIKTRPDPAILAAERRARMAKTAREVGFAVGVAATVEYLLDPDRGRARRAKVQGILVHGTHRTRGGLTALSRDLVNRSGGVVAGTRYRFKGRHADDRVVHERAREMLGHYVSHPHSVEVHVDDGNVTLTGDVLAGEDKRACSALKRVPGIKDVDARWRVHPDATGVPGLQGDGRSRRDVPELLQENWSATTRFLAGSGGVALCAVAGRLPGPLAWSMRGAGAVFTARAVTNKPLKRLTGIHAGRRAVDINDGIAIAAAPEKVWSQISDYSVFPRLMPDVREVRRDSDGVTSHWEIAGPAGVPIRFQAEETNRVEGREISWQTTDGQLIAHAGKIRVDPEPDVGSRVQVHLSYNPVAGAIGHAMASLFGVDPRRKLSRDLLRLKSFVETGKEPLPL